MNTTKQNIAAAVILLCCTAASTVWSATITMGGKYGHDVHVAGPIEQGDAQTLVRLLAGRRSPALNLYLNSPGGSLLEAGRLAKVVEKAALNTNVADDGTCASACFFVWIAGASRHASGHEVMLDPAKQQRIRALIGSVPGYVGLHRPFEREMRAPDSRQASLMRGVTEYLDSKLVPRRLIDSMMTRPSNDIYWMTMGDLEELGTYAPALEEFLIQRCSYDRNYADKLLSAIEAGDGEREAQVKAAQLRSEACQVEETGKLRDRGHAEIRKGWRP